MSEFEYKKYNASDFEIKFILGDRFRNQNLSTCQISEKKSFNKSRSGSFHSVKTTYFEKIVLF